MAYKSQILIAALLFAFLAGAGIWLLNSETFKPLNFAALDFNLTSFFSNQEQDSETFKLLSVYANPAYGFSFQHPEGFKVSEFQDETGDVLLFEKSSPSEALAKEGFQIFIAPFDESSPLTPERVKKDLPQIEMKNPKNAELAGIPALHFGSGATREFWFVKDGFLYEVSYFPEFENMMFKILKTWKFKE